MHVATAPARVELWLLFKVFLFIGVTSVGGGASAHIHDAVVTKNRWLDEEHFVEALTVARSLPGTNVSNLAAFVGTTLGGFWGAGLAGLGVVVPGAGTVLGLAFFYVYLAPHTHTMKSALHGLTIGATAVMVVLALQVVRAAWNARGGAIVAAATFCTVAFLNVSVAWALIALLPIAVFLNRKST